MQHPKKRKTPDVAVVVDDDDFEISGLALLYDLSFRVCRIFWSFSRKFMLLEIVNEEKFFSMNHIYFNQQSFSSKVNLNSLHLVPFERYSIFGYEYLSSDLYHFETEYPRGDQTGLMRV